MTATAKHGRRLLWVGDCACPSGFARATHGILDVLHESWDVSALAIGYLGGPHGYPWDIYPAAPGGDGFGVGRMPWAMEYIRPDVLVIQNDPWNVPAYLHQVKRMTSWSDTLAIGAMAVDGLNCRGSDLNDLDHVVFWTEFGRRQATVGGLTKPASVIPLGVDTSIFYPGDRATSRQLRGLPAVLPDGPTRDAAFIFGCVNRNQPRKRMDLLIRYFADFLTRVKADDAYLWLHVAPTGDQGYDIMHLAQYYGVANRVILSEPTVFVGDTDSEMADLYRCFDVAVTTTQGEGFGLTTFEAMACGIPCICPDWSALGELVDHAAVMVPCFSTAVTPGGPNAIGGIPDQTLFVDGMVRMYQQPDERLRFGRLGFELASNDRFSWRTIGLQYAALIEAALVAPRSR